MRFGASVLSLTGAALLAALALPATAGAAPGARPVSAVAAPAAVPVAVAGEVIRLDPIARKPVAMPARVTGSILSPVPRVVILQRLVGASWQEIGRTTVAHQPLCDLPAQHTRFAFGLITAYEGAWQLRAVARGDAATNRYIFSGNHTLTWYPALSARVSRTTAANVRHSYRKGCPVGPANLRTLRLSYYGFDNRYHRGVLIVHKSVVKDLKAVFRRAVRNRFPIEGMRNVDAYAGKDPASMRAGNTSAFNCRKVVGNPYRLSRHSWGDAIDINPRQNPYQDATGKWWPENSASYRNRSNRRPGMHYRNTAIPVGMRREGWKWGARWSKPDYHHFSRTGQ